VLKKKSTAWLSMILAFGLVAAACSEDEDPVDTGAGDDGGETTDDGGSSDLSGTIVVSGSSTVEPISIAVSEAFQEANPGVDISVDGPGTGDGFELFCNGETDVNDASSKIKDEQIASCEDGGVEFIELQIGNDGISLLTNEANDAIECVTLADIYALAGPESQGIDNWADAQDLATELGSSTELPDAPLNIVGPGEESGTFSSFVELVIEEFNEDRGQDATTRPDYQASADDNVIIQGIQGSDTSFGWVGFAFAKEAEGVKILDVDGGDGCVTPDDATIADGSYPVSRPLFIYVNKAKAEENPALAAWVDYYLGDGVGAVSEVGYVDLSDEDLEATRALWEARTTGAQ
jgi:phosphate transport system substrate-binding protein